MLKYSDNSIEKGAIYDLLGDNLLGNNSLGNNLLGGDLLGNNNPAHIDSNINIDIEAESNPGEDMTGNNLLEENFRNNVEDLFQQIRDQTTCKRLTKEVLEQMCSFF